MKWMAFICDIVVKGSLVTGTLAGLSLPLYLANTDDPVMGERWATYGQMAGVAFLASVGTALLFWMIGNFLHSLICDRERERRRQDRALVAKTRRKVHTQRDAEERIVVGLASRIIQRLTSD